MIWAGFALWLCGVGVGGALSAYIFVHWIAQQPQRLGTVVRWIVNTLAAHNDGAYIKMYASLFDTQRATKSMVFVRPEDMAEAIAWYAVKLKPIPLDSGKGIADGCRENQKDARAER